MKLLGEVTLAGEVPLEKGEVLLDVPDVGAGEGPLFWESGEGPPWKDEGVFSLSGLGAIKTGFSVLTLLVSLVSPTCAVLLFLRELVEAAGDELSASAETRLLFVEALRLRFLITSDLRLSGRSCPCNFKNNPQALHNGWPSLLRR